MPTESFKPKPSSGWAWWVALAAVMFASAAPVLFLPASEEIPWWVDLIMWGTVGLGLWFLAIAIYFPAMRYHLTDTELVLSYGSLLAYRIPYPAITRIERRDLKWSSQSSMRLPGLALWTVPTSGSGRIRMCSTRSTRGVLLISVTDGHPYGISPAEEDRFVHELLARTSQTGVTPAVDLSSVPQSR
ncbi:MAG: hypothetical protein D9V44_07700 [Actinobacteria bacterium]|nr:MAG: hypothetical protein D9V44_07700 [Actinomycetota bacterium]